MPSVKLRFICGKFEILDFRAEFFMDLDDSEAIRGSVTFHSLNGLR